MTEEEKVHNIYSLLDLSPEETYQRVFYMRGITIKNKLSIVAGCLNDFKSLSLNGTDPKDRNRTIKKAGQSLQQVVAKARIADGVC